jgi:hypothetical protein
VRKLNFSLVYFILGIGLVVVHLDFLGQKWGFGLIVGYTLLIAGTIGLLLRDRPKVASIPKFVLVPVLIIILSSLVGVVVKFGTDSVVTFVTLLFGLGLILVGKKVGKDLFWLIVPLSLIISISSIIESLTTVEQYPAGGSWLTGNSGLAACILGLSILFLEGKWRWLSIPIAVGIFFTGDHWSIIALGIVGIVMLIRRESYGRPDWRVVLPLGIVLVIVVGAFWTTGLSQRLYGIGLLSQEPEIGGIPIAESLNGRLNIYREVVADFSPLGHGTQLDTLSPTPDVEFNPKVRYGGLVHNIPLMVLDDIGILAALSWLFLMGYFILKSKDYRYHWIFILVVSMFSYWFWIPTALGSWAWTLVGISSLEGLNGS